MKARDQRKLFPYCFLTRVAVGGSARRWNLKARCDKILYLSFINSSLNASVGVRHPRHFLGVLFKRSQIDFISRFESAATGASRGKYLRARLFRFSTEPFCQGACGSQNHASVPMPGFSLRQSRNSIPRSKVIDLRAGWGRGSMMPISLFITCVVLRSLLRNNTAKRVLRSTREATFVLPCARSKIIKSPSHSPKVLRVFT